MTKAGDRPDQKPRARPDKVRRPSSATARWHMSTDAIDRDVLEIGRWSDLKCVKFLAALRWGSFKQQVCPHCSTGDAHYWRSRELRWKCKGCGKTFSVTSQSVFANRRMPLQKLLAGIFLWTAGAAGRPALEMRRILKFGGYNTAFNLEGKLREALGRTYNTGIQTGVIEMDGAVISGWRSAENRGRPLSHRKTPVDEAMEAALLTTSAKQRQRKEAKKAEGASGPRDEYGRPIPELRRTVINLRKRGAAYGQGAIRTRVGVGRTEGPKEVAFMVERFTAPPESILATDSGTAFSAAGRQFRAHLQVNHQETLSAGNGVHVNLAESFTARQDRSERGIYLNIEPKYQHDYAVETAFREDHRRLAPGAQADRLTHIALTTGLSRYWRGFTHGHHRDYEILVDGPWPAAASGPKKGHRSWSKTNGPLPR